MHILYVHQNFPAQFGHLAEYLIRRRGIQCTFVSHKPGGAWRGVRRIQYRVRGGATPKTNYFSRSFENYAWHSQAVYEALRARPEIQPDVIVGHSGFGSTVFLADLYDAPIVNFFEYYYRADGQQETFRPAQPLTEAQLLRARTRNAMLLLDLQTCAAGYSPTNWQRTRFPAEFQPKLTTIFDGIDTDLWRRTAWPHGEARQVAGRVIPAGTRVVTYCSRGFESMRGFDVFMKLAQRICAARSDVVFVCVGSDRVCYGGDLARTGGKSFREHILSQGKYDLDRFIFTGLVPPPELARIMNLGDLHIYLTEPFILSWSLMDALACGCTVLASRTAPVEEVIGHDRNGLLADFFDVQEFARLALAVLDDPPAYRRLGEAGIATIHEQYSLERVAPRMLDLYQRAANSRSSHSGRAAATIDPGALRRERIDKLRRAHPWPAIVKTIVPASPNAAARRAQAKMAAVCDLLDRALPEEEPLAVELRAGTGHTTRAIAKAFWNVTVVAVGHWCDTVDGEYPRHWQGKRPRQLVEFAETTAGHRGQVIPLRATTELAFQELTRSRVAPDAIFLNATTYRDMRDDLELAFKWFPRATVVRFDWRQGSAGEAVREFIERHIVELETADHAWRIWRELDAWSGPGALATTAGEADR